jgi:hypothetical protein
VLQCDPGYEDGGAGHCRLVPDANILPSKPDLNDDVDLTITPNLDQILNHQYKYKIGTSEDGDDLCPSAPLDNDGSTCKVLHFPVGDIQIYWTITDESAGNKTYRGEFNLHHYELVYDYEGGTLDDEAEPTYPSVIESPEPTYPGMINPPNDDGKGYYYLAWDQPDFADEPDNTKIWVDVAQQRDDPRLGDNDTEPEFSGQYIYADDTNPPIGPAYAGGNASRFLYWQPYGVEDTTNRNSGDSVDLVDVAGDDNYRVEYDAVYEPACALDPSIPADDPVCIQLESGSPDGTARTGLDPNFLLILLIYILVVSYMYKKRRYVMMKNEPNYLNGK